MDADLGDDDSSEDDDYVPDKKKMQQTDAEINKQNGTEVKEQSCSKSGIAMLKE